MDGDRYPLVSIILLNYNGEKFSELWQSIFGINYPNYEIIFVDNGSKDNSLRLFINLSQRYEKIKTNIVKIENNIGYSRANNLGITYANGKYVVLLSNDIEVERDWLINMIRVMESDRNIAVAQSVMYSLYKKHVRDYQCNYIDVLGFCHNAKLQNRIEEVFFSEGAVMFIRKKVIDEVGGLFDENYFMFDEDIDFCWRVRLRGYKVCVVQSSRVYHARGGTVTGILMKTDPSYVFLIARNKLVTFFKNLELKSLLKYLPLVTSSQIFKGIWLISNGKKDAGLACLKGVTAFFRELPKNYTKRKKTQLIRLVNDEKIFEHIYPLTKSLAHIFISSKKLSREWFRDIPCVKKSN